MNNINFTTLAELQQIELNSEITDKSILVKILRSFAG